MNTEVWVPRMVCGGDAGVLQSLPCDFEQQPLLGIHRRGLARGDPEELRVELIGLPGRDESALTRADRARHRVVLGVEGVRVPALRRHPNDATARLPATTSRTRRVMSTPPGSRHPMPTTAIGSVSPFSAIVQARTQFVDLVKCLGDDRPAIRRCISHPAQFTLSESCCQ